MENESSCNMSDFGKGRFRVELSDDIPNPEPMSVPTNVMVELHGGSCSDSIVGAGAR